MTPLEFRKPETVFHKGRALSDILKSHREWLENNKMGEKANLSDADLGRTLLAGANLAKADLRRAALNGTNMRGAILIGANLVKTNLMGANLQNASIRRAKLKGANISNANLQKANLWGVDLTGAKLYRTNLHEANLVRAILRNVDLREADLREADLRHTLLSDKTTIIGSRITGAKLYGMHVRGTLDWSSADFEWVDFGIDPYHQLKINKEQLTDFLEGKLIGETTPEINKRIDSLMNELANLKAFIGQSRGRAKVFLSHSHVDKLFVLALNKRFEEEGISTWLDNKDLDIGDVLSEAIAEGIKQSWIFLIIISPSSIGSRWVKEELDEAYHQKIEGDKLLLPVLIGDLLDKDIPQRLKHIRYADFRDEVQFNKSFSLLIRSIDRFITKKSGLKYNDNP